MGAHLPVVSSSSSARSSPSHRAAPAALQFRPAAEPPRPLRPSRRRGGRSPPPPIGPAPRPMRKRCGPAALARAARNHREICPWPLPKGRERCSLPAFAFPAASCGAAGSQPGNGARPPPHRPLVPGAALQRGRQWGAPRRRGSAPLSGRARGGTLAVCRAFDMAGRRGELRLWGEGAALVPYCWVRG